MGGDDEESLARVFPPFDIDDQEVPYVVFPVALLRNGNISAGAKVLYCLLRDHVGGDNERPAWPAQETLSERLGVDEKTVRRYLRELQEWGLIMPFRMGHMKANRYWVAPVYAMFSQRRDLPE
jgi:hypothetical protein